MIDKKTLRAEMKARLRNIDEKRFSAAGKTVSARLFDSSRWRSARVVCAFLPMRGEIDTVPVCEAAVREGKALCLPRIVGDDLSFRLGGMDGPWSEGPFGIREPLPAAPPADFASLPGPVLVVAPGLAFDRSLRRLGRGKGYYDRFLRSLRGLRADVFVVGVALEEQLVDEVPVDGEDEKLDALLTG